MTGRATSRATRTTANLPRSDDFPLLASFFRGYLHQDFAEEYETAAAALDAFRKDVGAARARALEAESRRLATLVADVPLAAIRELLRREFGSGWYPRSKGEVLNLLGRR